MALFARRNAPGRRPSALLRRVTAVVALATFLAACTTIRQGGAPQPSFDVDRDLEQLAKQFGEATSIDDFYKAPRRAVMGAAMSDYPRVIGGDHSLAEINNMIEVEEAGASKFLGSEVKPHEGKLANVATFRPLAPGTVPPLLTVVKQGEPQPPGTTKEWSGVMLVEGKMQAVIAYRSS